MRPTQELTSFMKVQAPHVQVKLLSFMGGVTDTSVAPVSIVSDVAVVPIVRCATYYVVLESSLAIS